jgi:hypothetical protein
VQGYRHVYAYMGMKVWNHVCMEACSRAVHVEVCIDVWTWRLVGAWACGGNEVCRRV